MVLVDPRVMQTLSSNEPPVRDSLSDAIRRLDGDMEAIMRTPSMALSEKVTRYNEVLNNYLRKTDDYRDREHASLKELKSVNRNLGDLRDVTGAVPDAAAAVAAPVRDAGGMGAGEDDEMLGLVSDKFRPKARRLLAFLKRQPGVSWTDRGELSVGGHVYRGSHIVDLVSKSVKPSRATKTAPAGWEPFVDVLKRGNVPLDLMTGNLHGAVHGAASDSLRRIGRDDSESPVRRRGRARVRGRFLSSPVGRLPPWSSLPR